MSVSDAAAARSSPGQADGNRLAVGWVDFIFCLALIVAGFLFLRDAAYWARDAYVGQVQFGDAEFWWNGALHFSHGIVAENPNLIYRMGYALFGGLIAAACGPDYRIFHAILLALFLALASGLYFSLRERIGRLAAAAAVCFLVFNPYTAEWLAISCSDGLGMIFNLAALLALIAGVQKELRPGWVAVFGVLFACNSLTRPLMTPFIAPAMLAVVAAGWGRWRTVATTLVLMLGAFLLPTLAWMGLMAATTGNFALTGGNQDSSAFYAASDPQIQVWRPDVYDPVVESARKRFHTSALSSQQLNDEFWARTRENYRQHWRYHLIRLEQHAMVIARFSPAHTAKATAFTEMLRVTAKWLLVLSLGVAALRRRRWTGAAAVVLLGSAWAAWPLLHAWIVFGASAFALAALILGKRDAFLWAAYWWVGVFALYLTGGTWGPPLGPIYNINALGYRLGFQCFFAADLLVIYALGCIAQTQLRPARTPETTDRGWLTRPSPFASRLGRIAVLASASALAILLSAGSCIVIWRMVALKRTTPVAYPDIATLPRQGLAREAHPVKNFRELRGGINAHADGRFVTSAMSSSFIWNLPGQQRCMLLLYQQDFVQPVRMEPNRLAVEVPQHLPEKEWTGRQGAWLVRSIPDTAQVSNLPYYVEMAAVQAFIPLSADGKSYDTALATVFPLAKAATQLAASGELKFRGSQPEWATSSGPLKYPRRFALRRTATANPAVEFTLDLSHARGKTELRFGIQLEAGPGSQPRSQPCTLRLMPDPAGDGNPPWQATLVPGADVLEKALSLDGKRGTLHFTCENLLPSDTLWFYEFVLTADDFAP